MAIKAIISLCFAGLLMSCATDRAMSVPTRFDVKDNPSKDRFELVFHNDTKKELCLSPAFWPNASGNIPLTSARISVSVGGLEYQLDTFIEDCPDCTFRVSPGRPLTGYLNYSAFKLPTSAKQLPKNLHLTPRAVVCR